MPIDRPRLYRVLHRRQESLGRLGLHAKHLAFVHPRSGSKVTFTSEMPRQFRELSL